MPPCGIKDFTNMGIGNDNIVSRKQGSKTLNT